MKTYILKSKPRTFLNFYEDGKCKKVTSALNGLTAIKQAQSFLKSPGKFKTREVYAWTAIPAFKMGSRYKANKDAGK